MFVSPSETQELHEKVGCRLLTGRPGSTHCSGHEQRLVTTPYWPVTVSCIRCCLERDCCERACCSAQERVDASASNAAAFHHNAVASSSSPIFHFCCCAVRFLGLDYFRSSPFLRSIILDTQSQPPGHTTNMSEFVLTPHVKRLALRPEHLRQGQVVFIVSKETSKPIRVGGPGRVNGHGGLGMAARFQVMIAPKAHPMGPVVRFRNAATGLFLAIKGGELTTGGGGAHCEFVVQHAQQAVFLRKFMNPGARIGFNPNGA